MSPRSRSSGGRTTLASPAASSPPLSSAITLCGATTPNARTQPSGVWAPGPISGVGMPHAPGDAPLRRAAASFANRVVVATMSSGARRCGNDVVGAGPAVSWSGLCGPASPRDHTFSAASMTNRRTGGVVAQLAGPRLPGPVCPRPGVRSGSVPRRPLASHLHQDLGALGLPGALCVPGCTCSRKLGSSRQMMLWLTSGHDVPLETAWSDHRFTVASMTSRRAGQALAKLMWSPLAGPVGHNPFPTRRWQRRSALRGSGAAGQRG
jgi:hypothetical protein